MDIWSASRSPELQKDLEGMCSWAKNSDIPFDVSKRSVETISRKTPLSKPPIQMQGKL